MAVVVGVAFFVVVVLGAAFFVAVVLGVDFLGPDLFAVVDFFAASDLRGSFDERLVGICLAPR